MFLNVPLLCWAPESHERIKGACRCKELNTSKATKRKWPTGMVSHFILIAWIMELVSKANVSCFIAFHSPPCFIALSKLFFPLKSQLSPHMAFLFIPRNTLTWEMWKWSLLLTRIHWPEVSGTISLSQKNRWNNYKNLVLLNLIQKLLLCDIDHMVSLSLHWEKFPLPLLDPDKNSLI